MNLCAILLACGLVCGCATSNNPTPAGQRAVAGSSAEETAPLENDPATGARLLKTAHSAIGTPYVPGGTTTRGFDCSGFVCWAYDSIGVQLPRTAREQSVVGEKITRVEDMQAGDIVAFRHPRRGYHTGIYVGDGKFIHSPRKRTRVRINSLSDSYFSSTLLGARRVDMSGADNLVAQAKSRLEQYAARNKQSRTRAVAAKSASTSKAVSKGKKAGKAIAAKKAVKSTASKVKTAAKAKSTASKSKTAKTKTATKTVASAKSPARAVQGKKSTAAKKPATRAVSMLNKSSGKAPARKRGNS